jgi:RNA polymerase sigma factor for flagellar operon FliA
MPSSIEEDDLVSYGLFGLFDAIEKFKPELGWKFKTYATSRIRGAIFDEMRANDWVPRSVRDAANRFEVAYSDLESELKSSPTLSELADKLGITVTAYLNMLAKIDRTKILFHDGLEDGAEITLGDSVASFADRELAHTIALMISQLPERESNVLTLYYFGDLMLKEIGSLYGFSEAWACRVHGLGIRRLRAELI